LSSGLRQPGFNNLALTLTCAGQRDNSCPRQDRAGL
jgi:hypothetical protein